MPGAMHRMGVYLGLVEDEDYDDADGYAGDPERAPRDERRPDWRDERLDGPGSMTRYGEYDGGYDAGATNGHNGGHQNGHGGYVEDYPPASLTPSQPTYQITALHPRTYNEARTIGEHFRKSTPVIMNLTEMDDADAKRLVDFAAGLTFGLHGRIERVTAKVFLLSPHNVTVTAQDKARIENGFFNQS